MEVPGLYRAGSLRRQPRRRPRERPDPGPFQCRRDRPSFAQKRGEIREWCGRTRTAEDRNRMPVRRRDALGDMDSCRSFEPERTCLFFSRDPGLDGEEAATRQLTRRAQVPLAGNASADWIFRWQRRSSPHHGARAPARDPPSVRVHAVPCACSHRSEWPVRPRSEALCRRGNVRLQSRR